jgi:hypothetical protein
VGAVHIFAWSRSDVDAKTPDASGLRSQARPEGGRPIVSVKVEVQNGKWWNGDYVGRLF